MRKKDVVNRALCFVAERGTEQINKLEWWWVRMLLKIIMKHVNKWAATNEKLLCKIKLAIAKTEDMQRKVGKTIIDAGIIENRLEALQNGAYVHDFIEKECVIGSNEKVDRQDLYGRYREYCKESGYVALNYDSFLRCLANKGENDGR